MKIYSVSTRYYFAFGALVSEKLSMKIHGMSTDFYAFVCFEAHNYIYVYKYFFQILSFVYNMFHFLLTTCADLPGVTWVLPDSYLDITNKTYGGACFFICIKRAI